MRINRVGNVYEGPLLEIKVERFEGFFQQPSFHFGQNDAHGEATRADFLDENHTVVHEASYTTCRRLPGPSWMPDWVLRAATITLDNDEETGVADGAYLYFKGVPILPVPAISFPLTEKRKSGLLPLTAGFDSISGTTLALPYYWNIAPNRDATITPTLMTARGVDLGVAYRYLEPGYTGKVVLDSMPGDKLRDLDRWGLAFTHNATLQTGLPNVGPVALALNINRVSDDNYWKDFASTDTVLSQRLLPGDLLATWASGEVSGTVHVYLSVGMAMQQTGFRILNDIVWEKPNPPPNLGCRCFTHSTEILLWATKAAKGSLDRYVFNYAEMKKLNDGRQMKNVWRITAPGATEKRSGRHPTQKPVALIERCLKASTLPAQRVVDPFAGSGSTAIAALRNDRTFSGCEIDQRYADIAVQRLTTEEAVTR